MKNETLANGYSTLINNFISPAGLVTLTFTSPEIFLLALKIDEIKCARYGNNFYLLINNLFQILIYYKLPFMILHKK